MGEMAPSIYGRVWSRGLLNSNARQIIQVKRGIEFGLLEMNGQINIHANSMTVCMFREAAFAT